MDFFDTLKNLNLDSWYKVFVAMGAVVLISAIFISAQGLTNGQAMLLGAALFLIGIGEWKNQKTAVDFKPPNAYTGPAAILQYKIRQPDLIGNLFILLGIGALILFMYLLIKS